MKHLRRYNEDKNIENLEDCLQEVFDKYHILQKEYSHDDVLKYYISIFSTEDDCIFINSIPNNGMYKNIWTDLYKIKDTIEKRIKLKIQIIGDTNRNRWIAITIPNFYKQGFLRNISENFWSKADTERLKRRVDLDKRYVVIMEDLEDYLQEAFDKFSIKRADVSPTDLHGFSVSNSDNYYRTYKNGKGFFSKESKAFQVPILSIELNISYHDAVLEYLLKIKPTIEKRLGKKIEFGENMFNRPESRTQIGVYVPNINESISEGAAIQQQVLQKRLDKLDELSDYFQEFFDKHKISEKPYSFLDSDDHYNSNDVFWCINTGLNSIMIVNVIQGYSTKLFKEINKLKDHIQNRIGYYISTHQGSYVIYIKLLQPFENHIDENLLDNIKMGNVTKESQNTNDLEDYLQEIFDKYHLSEIEYGGQNPGYEVYSNMIFINNIYNIFDELIDDIVVTQPYIEKRLGIPIMLEYYGHHRKEKYHTYKKLDHSRSSYIAILVEEPSLDQRSNLGLY